MQLKLLWMGAVNMPAYRKAATEAVPDQCDNRYPEDFIERYNGPFVEVPGCKALAHMLPEEWGFVPNVVSSDILGSGDVWWSVGVSDELGREIIVVMEHEPDVDYEYDNDQFIINTPNQPRTMTDIQELVERFEPQIDHWWCHRNTSANPSEKEEETEYKNQSWEIVVADTVNFIEQLQWLLKRDGTEKVADHIKMHITMNEDVVTFRLVTDPNGNGDFPEANFELGDIIDSVSVTVHGSGVDVFVFYNAFMRAIECDPAKVDSIVLSYDNEENEDVKIELQKLVTLEERHCSATTL